MHVLLICRSFPHHRAGGMEWHVHDLAGGLMAAGHRVSVLTTPLPETPVLAPLEVNGDILFAGDMPGTYDKKFFWEMLRPAIRDRIVSLDPDVIHCQGFSAIPAWQGLGKSHPIVTTIHGTLWSETALRHGAPIGKTHEPRLVLHWKFKHRHAFSPLWKRFLNPPAAKPPPWIVVDSQFSARELACEAGWETKPQLPVDVVPLGFDLTRFPRMGTTESATTWGKTDGTTWLVAVGRMEPVKGFDILLKAFIIVSREFPDAHLVLAGRGSGKRGLLALRRVLPPELRSHVHFTGPVAGYECGRKRHLPSLLEAADLFLNADQGAPAFGLANAEALAMGTPVLASSNGAHGEVVRDEEDGRLVVGGVEEWADALRAWLGDMENRKNERDARAVRARKRFARDRMVDQVLDVYQKARDGHGNFREGSALK